MAPKRVSKFQDSYEKEFLRIKRSKKGDEYAYCEICQSDINLASTGKLAISIHQKTEKHKSAVRAAGYSQVMKNFFPNTSKPTDLELQTVAAEGWLFLI